MRYMLEVAQAYEGVSPSLRTTRISALYGSSVCVMMYGVRGV